MSAPQRSWKINRKDNMAMDFLMLYGIDFWDLLVEVHLTIVFLGDVSETLLQEILHLNGPFTSAVIHIQCLNDSDNVIITIFIGGPQRTRIHLPRSTIQPPHIYIVYLNQICIKHIFQGLAYIFFCHCHYCISLMHNKHFRMPACLVPAR